MSGHSKFANIKHKKEKMDSVRGKIFTRLGRELNVAIKAGGPEPASNSRLRDAIAKAKASNMPNDTIDRAIKKAIGEKDVNYESVVYEGYGPKGVAVIVKVLTDNRNRAAANVRNAFTKGDGNMGTPGCVSFMFDEKGIIMIERDKQDDDTLMNIALEAGASDFIPEEEGVTVETDPENFSAVREAFETRGIPMASAEVTLVPQTYVSLTDPDDIKKMNKLLDLLDEEDDVQDVYHNWENEA